MTGLPARLYLVTPKRFRPEEFAPRLKQALTAVPVACVRLDLGEAAEEDWMHAVNHLLPVCHERDLAMVVAEHHRLVEPLGLDGVHLGASRTPLRDVRKALGPDRIVGAAAGASRHQGLVLAEAGADYVTFGPVGDTGLLGDETRAEDDIFEWWGEMIETPSVAEGGVRAEDAARLTAHVDFVVPDAKLWNADDPATLLKEYQAALA